MGKFIGKLRALFVDVPLEIKDAYELDCASHNNSRFSILPFFNIFTQIMCCVIYLIIYPATFPELPRLDPFWFIVLSAVYIAINTFFIFAFIGQKRRVGSPDYQHSSHKLVIWFLISYIALESFETIIEVAISRNIYRLLAVFMMVTLLPLLRKREIASLLTLFVVLVEIGLTLLVNTSIITVNRYQEIVFVYYMVCVVVSQLTTDGAIRTFQLRHELIEANDKLVVANQQLEQLAIIDPLTQIHNRRAFDRIVSLIWSDNCRSGGNVTAIMVDIDNFKQYNDTYGHQMGDECLVAVAQSLKKPLERDNDIIARYGGEEFIAFIVHCKIQDAERLAEQMRASVEALKIPHEKNPGGIVTISVGVATLKPEIGSKYESLVKLADDALYRAKSMGKNRVCLSK